MPKGVTRDHSVQHNILHRLKIARGHLDRVITMAEDGHYCIDVVNQSLAVQAALRQADQVILRNHLQTCVARAVTNGDTSEVIEEVMQIMNKKS